MKKLILVVDDEESIRSILTEFFAASGYRVTAVSSPIEARKAVQREAPQFIISDLQLEDSDGLEMIRDLKTIQPNTPVMLLTGMLFDQRATEELLSKKVSCYLPKTSSLARVLEEVQRLIGPA